MPYTAEISRSNPTAIIFLLAQSSSILDQSSSMLEAFGAQPPPTGDGWQGEALDP